MYKKPFYRRPGSLAGLIALCCVAPLAMANCNEPSFEVDVPDGKTATSEEMRLAQEAVKAVVEQGEAFVACVRENERGARAERMANIVLDQMQGLAANFNRQLRYHRRAN